MKKIRIDTTVAIVLLLCSLGYFLSYYNYGISLTDEGFRVNPAMRILQGEVIYKDFWRSYPPGMFYLLAFLFWLFGPNLLIMRLLWVILLSLKAVIIYSLSKRIMPIGFAILSVLLITIVPGPWHKTFFSFFTLLNLWVIVNYLEKGNLKWLIVSGVTIGMSILFRQDVGVFGLMTMVVSIVMKNIFSFSQLSQLSRFSQLVRKSIKEIGGFLVPFVLILIPMIIYLYLNTALKPMFNQVFLKCPSDTIKYAYSFPSLLQFFKLKDKIFFGTNYTANIFIYGFILLFILIASMLITRLAKKKVSQNGLFLFSILILGILTYSLVIFQPNRSHMLQVSAPGCILGCYLLCRIFTQVKERTKNVTLYFITLLILLSFPFLYLVDNLSWRNYFYGGSIRTRQLRERILDSPRARVYIPSQKAKTIESVIKYIQKNTPSKKNIFVVPYEAGPMLYFLSNRQNSTKAELIGGWVNRVLTNSQQEDVIRDIEDDRTKLIVTTYRQTILPKDDSKKREHLSFHAKLLFDYIKENYHLAKQIGHYAILKRNE